MAFLLLALAGSPSAAQTLPPETWDVYMLEGAKVGHAHAVRRDVEENGRKVQHVEGTAQMTMKRLGQTVTIDMSILNVVEPNGDLIRFESTIKMANAPMTAKGTVENGKLNIEGQVLGQAVKTSVDCPAGTGGIDAIERSLVMRPMKPGEERRFKMLTPMLNVVADVTLRAKEFEETTLLEGKKARLLRVDYSMAFAGQQPMNSTAWIDETGALSKTVESGGMMMSSYRTTREIALREGGGNAPDLITLSIIKVTPAPRDPHKARKVVYRATLTDGDPAKTFSSTPAQSIKSLGPSEAEVTVRALRLEDPLEDPKPTPPTDADRKTNVLIQSDDPKVVELAGQVAQNETDLGRIAVALERHVKDSMKISDFSQALGSAAEVARTRRGDCTEHAVLLAAMARARGIPARVAVGLVYAPQIGGFAFHMWTEVWIKDRWLPLDGTIGQGGIGGGHLKLSDSNLADGSPTNFLPVYQVMGKLKLAVVSEEN